MSTDKRLAIKPALNQFNGGEISPQLEGRYDWDKYNYSAKLCKNFIPTIEGSLKRRGGSHFVALKRGSGSFSFKVPVELLDYVIVTPRPTVTLSINGENVPLSPASEFFDTGQFVTDTLTYIDGARLSYTITATQGYLTKSGTIVVNINQEDVHLQMTKSSSGTATLKFIAPTSANITLNGSTATSVTDTIGSTVTYTISLLSATKTGTVTITGNETYFVYKRGNSINISTSDILLESSNSSGAVYLPACKIRYVGVGAGGGSNTRSSICAGGGSGAGCDVVLNITEGQYNWVVGKKGENKTYSQAQTGENGTDTSLKKGTTNIVTNGGGYGGTIVEYRTKTFGREHISYIPLGGNGGQNTINSSNLTSTNWSKNGNRGGENTAGAAVYENYGKGGSSSAAKDGYLYISFVEE